MSRAIVASKKPVWITFVIALVLNAGLISVQAGRRIDTSFVRMWILDSLAPMEKLVDRTLWSVVYVWDGYFGLVGTHKENQKLKTQLEEARMQLDKQREEILEAQRLRGLLGLQESGLGKTVVARVIGRDPTRLNQTVTIDKGLLHGVKPDSAVITPEGIVGRVIHSSNLFSIVQLVLDSQSGVGVMLRSTRRLGIVKGTGARELDLDFIDDDNDLKEGEQFITSGQDKIYPKGLLVGVIASIGARRGLFKTVRIRPSVDFGRLEEVVCIVDKPQNVDVVDPTQEPPAP